MVAKQFRRSERKKTLMVKWKTVDGVAELRKRTGSKTSSYENNSNVMHDSAMNKITIFIAYILIVRNCLLYC